MPARVQTADRCHPRVAAALVALYAVLALASLISANALLGDAAVLVLATLLLASGLLRRSRGAWAIWLAVIAILAILAVRGEDRLALDLIPVAINAALCVVFARSLRAGTQPLIARAIVALQGPAHMTLPGVARYAWGLTLAWALLLGAQAVVLFAIVLCAVPGGLLAHFDVASPIVLPSHAARWYLQLGSYAVVIGFMLLEYAFRRWHLRDIAQLSPREFCVRLARRWPALVRGQATAPPLSSEP
ncbi:MAG TPA: xanthomonadin biosynthesis protein [Rhodanobacteraceae bacterium]|nr:xanthomonadin biosynthesis protein [Rhodanobacteraceae bacterium]